MLQKDTHWKCCAVDFLFAVLEAIVALAVPALILLISLIHYTLNTADANFSDVIRRIASDEFEPTKIIIYASGILSSTIAYYLVRLNTIRGHITLVTIIFIGAIIILSLGIPFHIIGLGKPPVNQSFALDFAGILIVATSLFWLFSLFIQRRISKSIPIGSDELGN